LPDSPDCLIDYILDAHTNKSEMVIRLGTEPLRAGTADH
jgi:hypothetical protein